MCGVVCPTPEDRAPGCSACETRNSKVATDLFPGGHAFYGPNRSQVLRIEL